MARQLNPPGHHPRLRSVASVAEYLAVDQRTVRRYIASGRLRAYRLGNTRRPSIRVDQADIETFLSSDNDARGAA